MAEMPRDANPNPSSPLHVGGQAQGSAAHGSSLRVEGLAPLKLKLKGNGDDRGTKGIRTAAVGDLRGDRRRGTRRDGGHGPGDEQAIGAALSAIDVAIQIEKEFTLVVRESSVGTLPAEVEKTNSNRLGPGLGTTDGSCPNRRISAHIRRNIARLGVQHGSV